MKVTIDLTARGSNSLISQRAIQRALQGCHLTLTALGKRAGMVKVFRITFHEYGKGGPGPDITVYFVDPLGTENSFGTGWRFMGSKGPNPSPIEIRDGIMSGLPSMMDAQLERAVSDFARVKAKLEALGATRRRASEV